ncbi:MAG: hypothetical protein JXA93_24280 [Anaerolineae bacterium]|nr:hypothetical protein [Anaerolineae bacterium]
MRQMPGCLTSFRSLGAFGLILLTTTAIVAWSWFNFYRLEFRLTQVYGELQKLDRLEDRLVSNLIEQQIQHDQFVLSGGDQAYLVAHARAGAHIDRTIAWFQARNSLLRPDETHAIEELARLQHEYRHTFSEVATATIAGDTDELARLEERSATQMALMHAQIADLIHGANGALGEAMEEARLQAKQSVMGSVVALVLLPLLAVWAFLVAGRTTPRVLALTNAVVAIEGNQYRPELLAEAGDRRDRLGQLARAVDDMARAITHRERALEAEIAELREDLYQARRRKRLPGRLPAAGSHRTSTIEEVP